MLAQLDWTVPMVVDPALLTFSPALNIASLLVHLSILPRSAKIYTIILRVDVGYQRVLSFECDALSVV